MGATWASPEAPTRGRLRLPRRVVIVAAAGYGKTRAVDALLAGSRNLESGRADHPGARAHPLVREGIDELDRREFDSLIEEISALPASHGVVLTARVPLPTALRARLPVGLSERGPRELALDPLAIAGLLRDDYGVLDPEAADRIHDATAGWPALVHLAADALARDPGLDLTRAYERADDPTVRYLREHVFTTIPPDLLDAVSSIRDLDPITPGLWNHLGDSGPDVTGETTDGVGWLERAGLLVPHPRAGLTGEPLRSIVPAVRAALAGVGPGRRALATSLRDARAAEWYAANGAPFPALLAYLRAGLAGRAEALLVDAGPTMLDAGDASGIVEQAALRPHLAKAAPEIHAEALHLSGHGAEARRAYAPLVRRARETGWTTALSRRVAALHYTLASLPDAVAALDAVMDPPEDLEGVLHRAIRANVSSIRGEDEAARTAAEDALRLAEELDDDAGLVAAYQAMAKVTTGAHKESYLAAALTRARASANVLAAARILGNQSFLLLADARYDAAVPSCREALLAAQLARPGALPAAMHNLAEALTRVGEFDEARWQLLRSLALCRRSVPGRTASGLAGLGDLQRTLGHAEQAHAAYTEAVALSRASGEIQVLVPALAGLAIVSCDIDVDAAQAAADEAVGSARGWVQSCALTALGRVALARGEPAGALAAALEAKSLARDHAARDLLADALELLAAATPEISDKRAALTEARSIWHAGGARPRTDRVDVLLARLDGADGTARSLGREAGKRLRQSGIDRLDGILIGDDDTSKRVAVRVLGGFLVVVDGSPVPLVAWRSRQARTLVKLLAARRGRPVTRGFLCEILWPADDPSKTAHRLSVLLATVRGILDPERAHAVDRYLAGDSTGLWLDLRHVSLDADALIVDATEALALLRSGEVGRAVEIFADIDARYRGDAFDDEPYEEWADALREECRAAWLRSVRHLAMHNLREGRVNDAHPLLVRLLAFDPYDERVHRACVRSLVGAGRHGEARRAFERWQQAMADVDAPPPDPAVLGDYRRSDATVTRRSDGIPAVTTATTPHRTT